MTRLRVVGGAAERRHAPVVHMFGVTHVAEVWTFAEWDRLVPAERPDDAAFISGIGYLTVGLPYNDGEVEHLREAARRARAEMLPGGATR